MATYIYTERNGIYIIDLQKTVKKLEEAYNFVRSLGEKGETLLFVGTKKQAHDAIREEAQRCGMFYVNARWLGRHAHQLQDPCAAVWTVSTSSRRCRRTAPSTCCPRRKS